jgi:hypothetical protein
MPDTYITDVSRVVSVWSEYGHRFMSDGGEGTESCLTCGAMYQLMASAEDPTRGEYMAANGDAPMDCTGNTSLAHGYAGERHCHEHAPDYCACVEHNCNCLLCNS